jgi:uncharacterized membrane protein YeaQ/YmgE (transglycosylase-associated protein family)
MTWTFTNLLIQIVVGGHVAASALHEHGFGAIGHNVAGLVGGFISGYFLQTLAVTIVTGARAPNEPRPLEVLVA